MAIDSAGPIHSEVYLDFNATTPVDDRVVEAMLPFFSIEYGNPGSGQHSFGRRAKAAIDVARANVAALIGTVPSTVLFTSGATESSNLFLKGICLSGKSDRRRILITEAEHKSVLEVGDFLASQGFVVDHIPVDRYGVLDTSSLTRMLARRDVLAVSVIAANNETGTLNPIQDLVDLVHYHGAFFHTDATQLAGRIFLDVERYGIDAASMSAHKMYGPKGVGALYLRTDVKKRILPLLHGGGQEGTLRAGTLNVPGIVGFGAAAALALDLMSKEQAQLRKLRDELHLALSKRVGPISLNGHERARLPNTLNIRIHGAEAEAVMANMPTVALSSGSACTSEVPGPSHVLKAMGLSDSAASEALRFSLGRSTTSRDIEAVVKEIARAASYVRSLSRVDSH